MPTYTIGLDYGTSSVRGMLVDTANGREVAVSEFAYRHGVGGVLTDPRDTLLARQHPQDYLDGTVAVLQDVLAAAESISGFEAAQVVGLGIDTTGSSPLPVNADGMPLALTPEFADTLGAMVYLWKDHTSHAEAAEITALAAEIRPEYLLKCGGVYSAEWFWAKILHCRRADPDVFAAAFTWVEHADWMPAVLTGTARPAQMKRGICAAGHKGLFHPDWGGYPDEEFVARLDPKLAALRRTLPDKASAVGQAAGLLSTEWATDTGLPAGIPVSIGAIDAHLGAVGCGIAPGTLVKNIGTSTCDMMVAPLDRPMPDIPGLCGIVPGSILPGFYGLEAGQSAVGDIFNWFAGTIQPAGMDHAALTTAAAQSAPGASGLLALDWHNGNRTVLVDQRLSGALLGMTLHTTPGEMYRAWIEATAFGARVIAERLEEHGQNIERIVVCGGIPAKSPLVMQVYADVLGRPIAISRSSQTAALGAAIAGAVAAGVYPSFREAMASMTAVQPQALAPNPQSRAIYNRLYAQYKLIHDAFGLRGASENLSGVMKELLLIRDKVRRDTARV